MERQRESVCERERDKVGPVVYKRERERRKKRKSNQRARFV